MPFPTKTGIELVNFPKLVEAREAIIKKSSIIVQTLREGDYLFFPTVDQSTQFRGPGEHVLVGKICREGEDPETSGKNALLGINFENAVNTNSAWLRILKNLIF